MDAAATASDEGEERPTPRGVTLPGMSWALAEAGRLPYIHLVMGFVFLPYFTSVVVADPVKGQEQVAELGKIAGLVAAFTAPLLGAALDRIGPRKPWFFVGTAAMAVMLALLWFARPTAGGLPIGLIIAILVTVKVLYSYTEVMHNSMLVLAADGRSVSRLSGISYAAGYGSSLTLLVVVLWALVLPAQYDLAWTPKDPLFGLDPKAFENIRIVGPLAALMLAVMCTPLILFARDHPRTGTSVWRAFADSGRYLVGLPAHLKRHPNAALFILTRMVYADGSVAMNLFIGIYAAGVMGWGPVEVLVFGIVRLAFMMTGPVISVMLEERFGSKRTIQIGLAAMIVVLAGMLGSGPHQVLFFWQGGEALTTPVWGLPIFRTLPELVFLGFAFGTGLFQVVMTTSSRAFLIQITPAAESGAFFGLYALASTATAWLAPMAIGYFTHATGTQQGGFAPVVFFFIVGLIGLAFVKRSAAPT
ncbi:MAG: hypothetical protein JWR84_2109 [Caulobacter sp.]|nr:hypothetical protein [Caulobacter sp.]